MTYIQIYTYAWTSNCIMNQLWCSFGTLTSSFFASDWVGWTLSQEWQWLYFTSVLPWIPFPRYLTQQHLLLHCSDSARISVNLFDRLAIIFFYHWSCTSGWRFSFSGVQSMFLELVKIYQLCFYCANASSPIHYCMVSFMHTWSTNFSIRMNAANCLLLLSDRFFFYKTISFHSFSFRNLFFHVCFLSPTLRRPQWQLQLGSNPACLLGFSLQFHLYLDYIYIEAVFEECHIAEIVVSTSVRGQDSAR